MLNIFRKIPIFKLDLGEKFISENKERIEIKDSFIVKYFDIYNKMILKFGSIGNLSFYQDFLLKSKEYYIFNNNSIYKLIYTEDKFNLNPETYLTSIIKEIDEKEGIAAQTENKINIKKTPDIKLPTDQYINEMIKKRKLDNEQ